MSFTHSNGGDPQPSLPGEYDAEHGLEGGVENSIMPGEYDGTVVRRHDRAELEERGVVCHQDEADTGVPSKRYAISGPSRARFNEVS
jgi:hypothetical protein